MADSMERIEAQDGTRSRNPLWIQPHEKYFMVSYENKCDIKEGIKTQ